MKHSSFHPQAHKCHVVILSPGDPSLTHLRPSSSDVPAGVTPEPESTSLSGKGRDAENFLRTSIPCYDSGLYESLRIQKFSDHSWSSTANLNDQTHFLLKLKLNFRLA